MSSGSVVASGLSSTIPLNDGIVMPMFGLGTYALSRGDDPESLTTFAVQNGYRLLDTAAFYGNEQEVGQGLKKSGIPRSDVFVVTKLHWDDHGYERCKSGFSESLRKLDTGYVDLYLIHTPTGGEILRTYDAMVELQSQGLIRSIGVSNFGVKHLEELRKAGRPTPSVNQIELHALLRRKDIVEYCQQHGIVVMGYSPMAKGKRLDDKKLTEMASKYTKSVGQLMIRWSVQKGYITIPKTSKRERILENAQVFDWTISSEDMQTLESMPEYSCMGSTDLTQAPWQP